MAFRNPFEALDADTIKRLFQKVPEKIKWDVIELGCDLVGLVHPAGDAASALIALWRGDVLSAAIGTISIIPVGDVLKIAKLPKYRASLAQFVRTVTSEKELTRLAEPIMQQLRDAVNMIPKSKNEHIEAIRSTIRSYFNVLNAYKMTGKQLLSKAREVGRVGDDCYVDLPGGKRLPSAGAPSRAVT